MHVNVELIDEIPLVWNDSIGSFPPKAKIFFHFYNTNFLTFVMVPNSFDYKCTEYIIVHKCLVD